MRRLGGVALAPTTLLGACTTRETSPPTIVLRPAPARQHLGIPVDAPTDVWAFNGTVPGPLLRFRQGDTADIEVVNALPEPTTVHWHGLRVPIGMDGVPHLSQPPIPPGGRFRYRFALPDAGTFWYHPHTKSHEQVTRGLYGAFIVDETTAVPVDAELTWVIADWLLDRSGAQRTDFGDPRDMTHAGRIGNTVTINGRLAMFRERDPHPAILPAGQRTRLRIINASSARTFLLAFEGATPLVIALDGHPVAPHPVPATGIPIAAAQRTDLLLDMPSGAVIIRDRFDRRREYVVRELIGQGATRNHPTFAMLRPNPLPEPDLARAVRHAIVLDGGARGRMRSARVHGRDVPVDELLNRHGMAWSLNGVAANDHAHEPLFTVVRDATCVLDIRNDTAWPHPMHLHGHAFRVLAVNGKASALAEWRDTVTVDPNGSVEIAFVADNPGDWMFHCHILQHQQGGMMASIRVR